MSEDVTIVAGDGQRLRGTVHAPWRGRPWLLVNSAMGVRRRFYRHLAAHLAAQGIGTLTYDYRGMGDSTLEAGRERHVRLEDWGRLDFPAALRWLREHHAPDRVVVLGHSVGGQLLGIAPDVGTVDGVVGVAAQSGYWRHWDGLGRARVFALWYAAIPLATALSRTFPGGYLGLGQHLPAGVARQWAAWGRDPDYARSPRVGPRPQFHGEVRCALRTYVIADDDLAPERAVLAWHDWFPNARRELVQLGSRNSAGARIGHFGFFDPAVGAAEWPRLAAFVRG